MAGDPVPQEVLIDFQNRTPLSVTNPFWNNAEHTMFTADVLFKELLALGPVAFSTVPDADTAHGREIWERGLAGDYGPIAEYVPLPPPPPDPVEALTRQLQDALARIAALEAR